MSEKQSNSRRGLYASIASIVIVFIITASTAFPGPWNKVADAGFLPKMNDEGFNLGLDLQGGAHLLYEADMSEIADKDREAALEGVRDVIERRVNAFGVSEPVVQTNISGGHYRVIVELAGVFDIEEAIGLIGETPILEFKLPTKEIKIETTPEQDEEIALAQDAERKAALEVLDRALAGEDFGELAKEFSIDTTTSGNNGYIGYVSASDTIFDGLVKEIENKKYKTGIIDGLYESTSSMHIINYLNKKQEEEVLLSHILICYEGASGMGMAGCESSRNKIEAELAIQDLAREVTKNNFAELAMENSDCPSGADGGELGWVLKGQMAEAFENAAFALKDGAISEVVETEFGYHIIYREDSRMYNLFEIAHLEMPWTTASDVLEIDPWINTELSGKHVKSASVAFYQQSSLPYVVLNFNAEGGDLFGKLTEENVGEVIGIFLDGEPISTPVVQEAIFGGEASITGNFTLEEARLLAQRLNAGALPVPINLLSQQTIGPTLGALSLEQSINAAIIGFLLVAIFMIVYYRLAGLLAVISLIIYAGINLALYRWLNVTMTLSGIAGFILSLGMAVDANVLIFERLKEELHSGRDIATAIDEGFRRAWTSIRDGNLTTLIAAAVLFSMSTSFIKGFALTLALGIIVSMLSAILITRVLLKWVSGYKIFRVKWLYNGPRKNNQSN